MGDWKTLSFTQAESTPDAKNFVFRRISQSATPFSIASTTTLHHSSLLSLQNAFSQSVFCWVDNINECLSYLNKELNTLGLPPLYTDNSFEERPASNLNLVALINCLHYMLQLHRKNVARMDELQSAHFKSFSEQDCLRNSQLNLQERVETLEQELATLRAKEEQAQKSVRNMNGLLKSQKEEVVKLQSVITSRGAQHGHDLKRKEQELSKLKEKMHQHLSDKRDKRMAIDVLNAVGRTDGRRSLWRTNKTESRREGEMYKVLANNYETQLKKLVLVNAELKGAVNQIVTEMREFLEPEEKLCKPTSLQSLVEEKTSLNESQDTDWKCVMEDIQKQWNSLKTQLEKLGMTAARKPVVDHVTDHDKEIAKLKLELEQSKEIIQEQQLVLQDHLAIKKEDLAEGPNLLEEMEWFNKERLLFKEQRENFKIEREKFTEAAIRLGQERKLFEEEYVRFRKEQFFNLTPFREHRANFRKKLHTPPLANQENISPYAVAHRAGTQISYSHSPLRTPSPPTEDSNAWRYFLPTTHELYQVLGINPERSFKNTPTAAFKRSGSKRENPSHGRDSASQTRNAFGCLSSALFLNESDNSFYIGSLNTPI
ncbi:afadin- and alpha-actinin-binding protein-like [Narcine bancroftii]|uniref:afadin- and alpha-actinin-binding protein-like n=1 Tax=Narcine bancroftii TaxID=1343680 RepID=UPI0038315E31